MARIMAEREPTCPNDGFRIYDGKCSHCSGESNMSDTFSLDTFLAEVKDSCTNHAERKGYTTAHSTDAGDVFGNTLTQTGIAAPHALGEIFAKWLEYQKEPRRVLAVKIAGWAWRLWLNTER